MKTKIIFITILITFVSIGCRAPKNLPLPEQVDTYQYGSIVKVRTIENEIYKGELLTVDTIGLLILPADTTQKDARFIPHSNVKDYIVFYAKPKNYNWAIPIYSITTASHGWFLIFSLPINLIWTSVTSSNAVNAYRYKSKILPLNQLRMFSRYPQGLPPAYPLSGYR